MQKIGTLQRAGRFRLTAFTMNPGSPSSIHHTGIARSLRFLAKHWQSPIKVNDLVRSSRMSRRGFLKAFVKHTGRHPGKELQRLRLEHAQTLITRSSHQLAALPRLCGYRSRNSFWVAFRRFAGVSPGRFRETTNAAPVPLRASSGHELQSVRIQRVKKPLPRWDEHGESFSRARAA